MVKNSDIVSNEILKFPSNTGITGEVFTESKIIYQNGEKLERNFFDLDNFESHARINSFVFLPLYGYQHKTVGVLQLYNRKLGPISEDDLKPLKAVQTTIGLILENTIELNSALDQIGRAHV